MGVSLVRVGDSRERVGDSRERGRGRGQGVSAINGHWPPSPTDTEETKTNKHALRPLLLLREKKTTLPPFCFEEQKTHTIAAISAGEQTIAAISAAIGEQRLIKHSIASQRGIHSVACKTLQEEKRSTLA